jgi:hypothetical protein
VSSSLSLGTRTDSSRRTGLRRTQVRRHARAAEARRRVIFFLFSLPSVLSTRPFVTSHTSDTPSLALSFYPLHWSCNRMSCSQIAGTIGRRKICAYCALLGLCSAAASCLQFPSLRPAPPRGLGRASTPFSFLLLARLGALASPLSLALLAAYTTEPHGCSGTTEWETIFRLPTSSITRTGSQSARRGKLGQR